MDWKRFLRPDLKKIVLLILFIFVLPVPFAEWVACAQSCITVSPDGSCIPSCPPYQIFFTPIATKVWNIIRVWMFVSIAFDNLYTPLTIFLMIMLEYVLSCTIVWSFDNFKNKR